MFCALALFVIFTLLSEVGKEKACKDKELQAKFRKTAFSFGPGLYHLWKRKIGRLPEFCAVIGRKNQIIYAGPWDKEII